jgi:hypothetical protein
MSIRHSTRGNQVHPSVMSFHTGTISSVEFSVSLLQDDWILTELLSNERAEAIVTDDCSASELAVMLGE